MQSTTNLTSCVRAFIMTLFVVSMSFADIPVRNVVERIVGLEADNYAIGRIETSGTGESMLLANWALTSTVSMTDFANEALTGGTSGLQYIFRNDVLGSEDTNTIVFQMIPIDPSADYMISLKQSPYWNSNNTWNGGNFETSQFQVTWAGGGVATVSDPDDQIAGLGTGSTFASGTVVQFSSDMIFNHIDSWQIDLPQGVASVQLDWSSVSPVPNSDLTREWVTFDTRFTVVPEPASGAIFGIAATFLFGRMRRRRR